jgi:hypothetical protein
MNELAKWWWKTLDMVARPHQYGKLSTEAVTVHLEATRALMARANYEGLFGHKQIDARDLLPDEEG